MEQEYIISPCSGKCIPISAGQTITIIDIAGGQVVDFLRRHTDIRKNFSPQASPSTATNPCGWLWGIMSTPISTGPCFR